MIINCLIFSKDRPLQLDATIRSLYKYCKNIEIMQIFVLYKATNKEYEKLYRKLIKIFPKINFIPESNFYIDTLNILLYTDFILFLVDDNIFIREFNIKECLQYLTENNDSLGFSLRLGKNITYCYPLKRKQNLPKFFKLSDNIIKFLWIDGDGDFGYPIEVSSSIYRTNDIWDIIKDFYFTSPNSLETILNNNKKKFINEKPALLSFNSSVTFCNPINIVQKQCNNRFGNEYFYPPEKLAELYQKGFIVDINKYKHFFPNACHQEMPLYLKKIKKYSKKKEHYPKVSVIIPCFNHGKYLPDAVKSVINQSYKNIEIIIVNDGSTDNTKQIAEKLIKVYDYDIKLINQKNMGVSKSRNIAIEMSKGDYILPFDADDILHKDMIKICIGMIKKIGNKKFIYVGRQDFGGSNAKIIPIKYNFNLLKYQNHVNYCSLYHKSLWEKVGGYRENMQEGYEDWDFWIAAGAKGYYGYLISKLLFFYRVKAESRDINARNQHKILFAKIILNNHEVYQKNFIFWAKNILN